MLRSRWFAVAAISLASLSLCFATACEQRSTAAAESTKSTVPAYRPTATIKDLMDSMIDPSADVVWESVATILGPKGIEERQPQTDEEWTNVRLGALRLVEGANLLMMPGRHVARPHEKSETPGVELEPEEMEKLVNQDRAAWLTRVNALHQVSEEALKAIDAKDAKALNDIGERLDGACENCHLQYWYPNQVLPPGYDRP
jgi:hypothetical protein